MTRTAAHTLEVETLAAIHDSPPLRWNLALNLSPLTGGIFSTNLSGTVNNAVGRWSIVHVFQLPEHSPPRYSANSLSTFLGMLSLGAISMIVAIAWSALDRR